MHPSTALAHVLLDEFLRCGVRDVVLSPGSRSTPLALELARAERAGELALHVRIDERSAGHLALGLAKASGLPVVVVTTSGTAAVNLHPAVVEADESGVPIVALTADRPPALRGVGANQSIDQARIFGSAVRAAVDVGEPAPLPGAVRTWRSTVSRLVIAATDPVHPGPVHLNVPFADPLVPAADEDPWIEPLDGRPDGRPWTVDGRLIAAMSTPLDDVLGELDLPSVPRRGLIILGDHADAEAADLVDELGATLGWPIIAEPSGNVAGCETALAHGPLLLAAQEFVDAHVPQIVVTVGRVGLTRPILRIIARSGLHVAVGGRAQWPDPTRSADIVVGSVPLAPSDPAVDPTWLADWQSADVLAAAAVETVLAGADFSGLQVARLAVRSVRGSGVLFLGASWPVRHVAALSTGDCADVLVLGNRGASGIDGCVSTAWGAALAVQREHPDAVAVALLGDLTMLYDDSALLVPAQEQRPDLIIVVSDNSGGGIFSQLEPAHPRFAEDFERVFGTPVQADIAAVAAAMGVPAQAVTSSQELREALGVLSPGCGVRIIVARTCDRDVEAAILRELAQAVQAAVGTVGPADAPGPTR